ncbi:hypothetical protein HDU67_005767, partial [Dinochytrium kinnereticum]
MVRSKRKLDRYEDDSTDDDDSMSDSNEKSPDSEPSVFHIPNVKGARTARNKINFEPLSIAKEDSAAVGCREEAYKNEKESLEIASTKALMKMHDELLASVSLYIDGVFQS